MTPESHDPTITNYYNRVIKLFEVHDIPYYNLFPAVEKSLKQYSTRELWSNPADGHPGDLVTEVYAKYTFEYMIKELEKLPNLQKFFSVNNSLTNDLITNDQ